MIWAKTDAGRREIAARDLVKDRSQRNLLLLINGTTSDEKLLSGVAGVTADDFAALEALGLIARLQTPVASSARAPATTPVDSVDIDVGGLDYAVLRSAIGRLISKELGLRGFALTMVLEESLTVADLKGVAQRLIKQIDERKGQEAAAAARKVLFGE